VAEFAEKKEEENRDSKAVQMTFYEGKNQKSINDSPIKEDLAVFQ